MKASGSPCPLDKISIIPFKRCPYLRSYITAVVTVIWQSGEIPADWKKECTVLVHRKGDTADPSNFRPITLESVPLKIFTSCLRDSMFAFLKANGFIEHQIQKGFLPNISGTFEHTAQMANVINTARGANEGGVGGVTPPPNNFNTRSQLQFDGDESVPLWACMYRISVYNTLS